MPAEDKVKLDSINTAGYDSVNQQYHGGLLSTQDYEDFKDLLENGTGSSAVDFTNAPRVTTSSDGFMLAADKAKLNKIKISDNATVEFCTTTEYEQMETKNSNIYFILDRIGAQLLVKNENGDDLLNNVNTSNSLFSSPKNVNTFPLVYNVPA
jgi:hypothetical protein